MAVPFDDIPLDFKASLGEVIIQWNFLELLMNMYLIHLLGKEIFENRSHIVFAHMTFPQKLDVLGALVAEVEDSKYAHNLVLTEYKSKIEPALKAASTERNRVVHGMYGAKDGKITKASITARGKLKFSWSEITNKELVTAINAIENAQKSLSLFAGLDSDGHHKGNKS